eukprot:7183812-Pyramimonas_sp.AAC.1
MATAKDDVQMAPPPGTPGATTVGDGGDAAGGGPPSGARDEQTRWRIEICTSLVEHSAKRQKPS